MRTHRKPVLFVILTALLAAVLGACSNATLPPVFYTLATEQDVRDDRGLEDDLAAVKMVGITVGPDTRYFLAAGSLFTRLRGDGERWSWVTPPPGADMCTTVEVYDDGGGERLWAGWYRTLDGTGLGLWSLDPAADPWVWSQDAFFGDGVMTGLLAAPAGSELLVGASTAAGSHALHYHSAPGASPGEGSAVVSSPTSFTDAAWDGAAYWVISGRRIYTGAAPGLLAEAANLPSTSGDSTAFFGGVLALALNDVYVSTRGGTLFRTTDGGTTWTGSGDRLTVGGTTVRFTRFVDATATTVDRIYVGTEGFGFYEFTSPPPVDWPLTRRPDYNISRLYNGAVNSFFLDDGGTPLDPSDDSLFVCVSGAGLWRGENYAAPSWTWKQE